MKNVFWISKAKKIVCMSAAAMARYCTRNCVLSIEDLLTPTFNALTLLTFDLVIAAVDVAEPFARCHLTTLVDTIHMIDGIVMDLGHFELK